jgi:hypothetical protein
LFSQFHKKVPKAPSAWFFYESQQLYRCLVCNSTCYLFFDVDAHITMTANFPKFEEETLRLWREVDAFKTQLRLTEGGPRFSFYDGPPFGKSSIRADIAFLGFLG